MRDLHKTHKLCWCSRQGQNNWCRQVLKFIMFKVQTTDRSSCTSTLLDHSWVRFVQGLGLGNDSVMYTVILTVWCMTRPILYKSCTCEVTVASCIHLQCTPTERFRFVDFSIYFCLFLSFFFPLGLPGTHVRIVHLWSMGANCLTHDVYV